MLRVFCFVFHLTLGVFLVATALIAYYTQRPFPLDVLPFSDDVIVRDTLILGSAAVVFTLQALTRTFKFAFFVWNVIVLFLVVRWMPDGLFKWGALIALFGAAWTLGSRRRLPIF